MVKSAWLINQIEWQNQFSQSVRVSAQNITQPAGNFRVEPRIKEIKNRKRGDIKHKISMLSNINLTVRIISFAEPSEVQQS